MRLLLNTPDRSPYWLVGDPALNDRTQQSGSLNDTIQLTRNQLIVAGSDWETVLAEDRGSQRVVITATTRREFENEIQRMDFVSSLGSKDPALQLHRWQGDVTVRIEGANGLYKDYTLPGAQIGLSAISPIGAVDLRLTYTVTCGGFGVPDGSGTSGALFDLIATDPGSTSGLLLSSVVEAAVQSEWTAGQTVVQMGVYYRNVATNGTIGPLSLEGRTILWFKDAAAYASYLGSSASLYGPVNSGWYADYNVADPNSNTWIHIAPGTSTIKAGAVGFTLPFKNAARRMQGVIGPIVSSQNRQRFGDVLNYPRNNDMLLYLQNNGSTMITRRLYDVRLARLGVDAYGAPMFTIGNSICDLLHTPVGDVQLVGQSGSGLDYDLVAYSED